MSETAWRLWLPEGIAALMVLATGFVEAAVFWAVTGGRLQFFAEALCVAFAVGMSRRAPGAALGLVWVLGLLHLRLHALIMVTEFALLAVFFGGARWGRPQTAVLSGLSVPLAVVVAFVLHQGRFFSLHLLLGGSRLAAIISREPAAQLVVSLIALLIVAAPWPAGLVMRFLDRARTSRASMLEAEEAAAGAQRETEHAHEIADLRDQQTRLALDVHDVVGHSLAVILAQAESGRYLDDTEKLKKTLHTIATSARSSLQDVRQVLSSAQQTTTTAESYDGLIAGMRGSGHRVLVTEQGSPRQLPGTTAAVAYRVFQEMLTNAIKHGRRDQPITVERHWPAAQATTGVLRIGVTNMTEAADDEGTGAGRGLDGMRRRLEEVGGHLDVQPAGTTFTVTAFLPVRSGA
jgi:signal transduction histidine kinase